MVKASGRSGPQGWTDEAVGDLRRLADLHRPCPEVELATEFVRNPWPRHSPSFDASRRDAVRDALPRSPGTARPTSRGAAPTAFPRRTVGTSRGCTEGANSVKTRRRSPRRLTFLPEPPNRVAGVSSDRDPGARDRGGSATSGSGSRPVPQERIPDGSAGGVVKFPWGGRQPGTAEFLLGQESLRSLPQHRKAAGRDP
jgi:hypothetical protein